MTEALVTATLTEVISRLSRGEMSSVELLEEQLALLDTFNPSVNAVVAVDVDQALEEARSADDARAAGLDRGPLHGVTMTIKDTWETAGLTTTAGAPELADHVPTADADVVRALREAGAIIYGKTNTPFYAADHQTYNEVHGLTRSPWDPERTVGGSSGGAAAALACGFTPAEVGSDIGGSIRVPAHFNGLFGLKPTHGVVSLRGHVPPQPGCLAHDDLEVAGPLARSVGDLRLLLDVLVTVNGFGGLPGAQLPTSEGTSRSPLRVGVWSDDSVAPVSSGVKAVVDGIASGLSDAGAEIQTDVRPGPSDKLHETFLRLLMPIMLAGVPDKVFAGLIDGDDQRLTVRYGITRHRGWLRANEARYRAQAAWAAVFEQVDVVLAPVSQTPAPPHNIEVPYHERVTDVDGIARAYDELLFWAGLATMPLLPAVVIPAGSIDGLPCGVQLIGPRWSDLTLLDTAQQVSDTLDLGFAPPPLVGG